MSVFLSIKSMRADFYLDDGLYKFISVPYDMITKKGKEFYIDMEKYAQAKKNKKISEDARFLFSLYTGEMFCYEKDGDWYEWFYNCVNNDTKNVIETRYVDRPSPGNTQGKRMISIGKKIKNLTKYHVDILGNKFETQQEYFWKK